LLLEQTRQIAFLFPNRRFVSLFLSPLGTVFCLGKDYYLS